MEKEEVQKMIDETLKKNQEMKTVKFQVYADLYKHEDNLIWIKLQSLIVICFGLISAIWLLQSEDIPKDLCCKKLESFIAKKTKEQNLLIEIVMNGGLVILLGISISIFSGIYSLITRCHAFEVLDAKNTYEKINAPKLWIDQLYKYPTRMTLVFIPIFILLGWVFYMNYLYPKPNYWVMGIWFFSISVFVGPFIYPIINTKIFTKIYNYFITRRTKENKELKN